MVLSNPRSFVCFGAVFLEGLAIYGITPFIGELLRMRGAGGLREAGFVIGGLGIGGLLYAAILPVILTFAKRPAQALGPVVYGIALPLLGATLSLAGGAAILMVTGLLASKLLGAPIRRSVSP
jgi:hypothetical protein